MNNEPLPPQAPQSPNPAPQYAPSPTPPPFVTTLKQRPRRSKKQFVLAGIIAALIVIAAGTYTFAFYIPSRPENVWNSSLGNTGKALSGLTDTLTSKTTNTTYGKSKTDGTFSYTGTDTDGNVTRYSGTLSVTADSQTVVGSLSATGSSDDGSGSSLNVKANLMAKLAANATYPDVYVQETGLDSLLGTSLDNQWISIPSSYLAQLGSNSGASTDNSQQLTQSDADQLTNTVFNTINADVLTGNDKQSILQRQSFVGHEMKNGRDAYHYKALVNKARAESFCSDLLTNISKTSAYGKLKGDSNLSDQISDCKKSIDDSDAVKTPFDVWMDSGYHVVSAIAFTDDSDGTKSTGEFGQKLTDLNVPTVYATVTSTDGTGTVTVGFNRTTLGATADMTLNSKDSDSGTKVAFTAHATVAPYTGTINYQPPSSSTTIQDLLSNLFGAGDTSSFDTTDDSASIDD